MTTSVIAVTPRKLSQAELNRIWMRHCEPGWYNPRPNTDFLDLFAHLAAVQGRDDGAQAILSPVEKAAR